MKKSEFLTNLTQGWADLQAYIDSLTPAQMTVPTDAAGWTVKDHLIHLGVWEDGMTALLEKRIRSEQMGIDKATWKIQDVDQINAVIYQQHRAKSLTEVLTALNDIHQRFVARIESLGEDDLERPYSFYQPKSDTSEPVFRWLIGNTYDHYTEHMPWMQAIVG